jgi:hypothetical protein
LKKLQAAKRDEDNKAAEAAKASQAPKGNIEDAGIPSESGEDEGRDYIYPLIDYRARQHGDG